MEAWGGIECSLNRIGDRYQDQFAYDEQYFRRDNLEKVCALGITAIRYPVLWEKNWPDESSKPYWSVAANLEYLRERNIKIIATLVHHGSGPLYAGVSTTEFAEKLAVYASNVAQRFPWINDYTPVNEPLTTARFCGLYGLWHPHQRDSLSFLRILLNECKGTVMAMLAIRKINPEARLVFTEDLAKIHGTAKVRDQVEFENHRRWLSIDLICGKVNENHALWSYILSQGISFEELSFFTANPMPPDVMGFNYYITSERFLDHKTNLHPPCSHGGNGQQEYADIEAVRTEEAAPDGPAALLREAWQRYHLPMAITEAHLSCSREEQLRWLKYIWDAAVKLENEGIDIRAVTFWSLLGAYGWDKLLTESKGRYETGAFDMRSGQPRATAVAGLIRALARQRPYHNPLLDHPGWWQRPIRLAARQSLNIPANWHTDCCALHITGAAGVPAQVFRRICFQRGIPYVMAEGYGIQKSKPWTIVNLASEIHDRACITFLTRSCSAGGIKLLKLNIYAQAARELPVFSDPLTLYLYLFNAGLDLLIDGETGDWHLSNIGSDTVLMQERELQREKIC